MSTLNKLTFGKLALALLVLGTSVALIGNNVMAISPTPQQRCFFSLTHAERCGKWVESLMRML